MLNHWSINNKYDTQQNYVEKRKEIFINLE